MTNPYQPYVQALADQVQAATRLPLGGFDRKTPVPPPADAPVALLFSPHPDDECITGLLPLRLMREAGWRIVNVPVTHGSRVERRAERHDELSRACAFLDWEWVEPAPDGGFRFQSLENLGGNFPNVGSGNDPVFQTLEKPDVITLLKHVQPAALFVPHAADWNARHISTNHLVMDALRAMPPDFTCTVIETEFWAAMADPNLMVEGDVELVADLVAATSFHVKEVERNPYHRLLPAWMMDNVRRGGELVGGQGEAAPDYQFATLYRLRKWQNGALTPVWDAGEMWSLDRSVNELC